MAIAPNPAITFTLHLGTMQLIAVKCMANFNRAQALVGQMTTLKNQINTAVAFSDAIDKEGTYYNEEKILQQVLATEQALIKLAADLTIPT